MNCIIGGGKLNWVTGGGKLNCIAGGKLNCITLLLRAGWRWQIDLYCISVLIRTGWRWRIELYYCITVLFREALGGPK